jgi:hypothetical protein
VPLDPLRFRDRSCRASLGRLPASDDVEGNPRNRPFDVTPGGRFMMIRRANSADVSGDLLVALNWISELRQKKGR